MMGPSQPTQSNLYSINNQLSGQLRRKEVENRMLYDQIDILKAAISKLENETGGFYLDKKSDKASEILEQVSSAVAAITV